MIAAALEFGERRSDPSDRLPDIEAPPLAL
jgi:hypothetical protein